MAWSRLVRTWLRKAAGWRVSASKAIDSWLEISTQPGISDQTEDSKSESYWFTQSRCSLTSLQLLIMKRGWSSGEADEANPTAFVELRTRWCRLMPGLLEPISATHICPYTVYIVRVQAMHSSMFVQPQHESFFQIYIWLNTGWFIDSTRFCFLFFLSKNSFSLFCFLGSGRRFLVMPKLWKRFQKRKLPSYPIFETGTMNFQRRKKKNTSKNHTPTNSERRFLC